MQGRYIFNTYYSGCTANHYAKNVFSIVSCNLDDSYFINWWFPLYLENVQRYLLCKEG